MWPCSWRAPNTATLLLLVLSVSLYCALAQVAPEIPTAPSAFAGLTFEGTIDACGNAALAGTASLTVPAGFPDEFAKFEVIHPDCDGGIFRQDSIFSLFDFGQAPHRLEFNALPGSEEDDAGCGFSATDLRGHVAGVVRDGVPGFEYVGESVFGCASFELFAPTDGETATSTTTPTPSPTPFATSPPTPEPSPLPTQSPTTLPTALPMMLPIPAPTPVPGLPDSTNTTEMPTATPELNHFDLASARFSSTGAEVFLDFPLDTDLGGVRIDESVPCEILFAPETLALFGTTPRCSWPTPRRISVALSSALNTPPPALVWVNRSTVLSRVVFSLQTPIVALASNAGGPFAPFDGGSRRYFVEYPEVVTPPVVQLTVPSTASACDDLLIDLCSSEPSFVGRDRVFTYHSNCSELLPSFESNITASSQTIASRDLESMLESLSVDRVTCDFSVSGTNFLDVPSDVVSALVEVSLESRLSVVARGVPPGGRCSRTRELRFFADVELSRCMSPSDYEDGAPELNFRWVLLRVCGDSCTSDEAVSLPQNVDTTQEVLSIPSYFLEVDATYVAVVEVSTTLGTYAQVAASTPEVRVAPSPLRVAIAGAARRSIPADFGQYELDGSASRDPDHPELGTGVLIFRWTCNMAADGSPCSYAVFPPEYAQLPTALVNTHEIFAGGNENLRTVALTIGLSVQRNVSALPYSESGGGLQWDQSAYTMAYAVEVDVAISRDTLAAVTIQGDTELGPDDTLRLKGNIESLSSSVDFDVDDIVFSWREVTGELDLDDGLVRQEFIGTPAGHRNLVVKPGLLREGRIYTFELTASIGGSAAPLALGVASVDVAVGSGPRVVHFDAVRRAGGTYDISAASFSEDSFFGSVEYRFSYQRQSRAPGSGDAPGLLQDDEAPVASVNTVVVQDFDFVSFSELTLLSDSSYEVMVEARSSAGQVAHATLPITADHSSSRSCELSVLLADLDDAVSMRKTTVAMYTVAALADFLAQLDNLEVELIEPDIVCPNATGNSVRMRTTGRDVRDTLFDVLRYLHDEDRIQWWHSQQLGLALALLTFPAPPLSNDEVELSVQLVQLEANFAELFVERGDLSQARAATDLLARAMTNIFSIDSLSCPHILTLRNLVGILFRLRLGPLLAGEAPASSASSVFAGSTTRFDVTDSGIVLSGGSESVQYSVEIVLVSVPQPSDDSAAGEYMQEVSLVVVSLDSPMTSCFTDSVGIAPEGSVLIIDLAEGDTDEEITENLNAEFVLVYSLHDSQQLASGDNDVVLCTSPLPGETSAEMMCGFHNETTDRWSTAGCETLNRTILDELRGLLFCRCDHLTTFAVIRHLQEDGCMESIFSDTAVGLFLTIYVVLTVFTGFLMYAFHAQYTTKRSRGRSALHYKAVLSLIMSQCVAQIAWLALYEVRGAPPALAFFSSLARVLSYWLFSIMIYQWSMLASRYLSPEGVKNTRTVCMGCVISVTLVLLALAVVFSVLPPSSTKSEVVFRAGSLIMFAFNFLTFLGLAISSCVLVRKVTSAMKKSGLVRESKARGASTRLFKLAFVFCMAFLVESCIILVSGAAYNSFLANLSILQSVYLTMNVVALTTVLWTARSTLAYHESRKREKHEKDRKPVRMHGQHPVAHVQDQTPAENFQAHLTMLQQAAERYFLFAPSTGTGTGSFDFSSPSASDLHSVCEQNSTRSLDTVEHSVTERHNMHMPTLAPPIVSRSGTTASNTSAHSNFSNPPLARSMLSRSGTTASNTSMHSNFSNSSFARPPISRAGTAASSTSVHSNFSVSVSPQDYRKLSRELFQSSTVTAMSSRNGLPSLNSTASGHFAPASGTDGRSGGSAAVTSTDSLHQRTSEGKPPITAPHVSAPPIVTSPSAAPAGHPIDLQDISSGHWPGKDALVGAPPPLENFSPRHAPPGPTANVVQPPHKHKNDPTTPTQANSSFTFGPVASSSDVTPTPARPHSVRLSQRHSPMAKRLAASQSTRSLTPRAGHHSLPSRNGAYPRSSAPPVGLSSLRSINPHSISSSRTLPQFSSKTKRSLASPAVKGTEMAHFPAQDSSYVPTSGGASPRAFPQQAPPLDAFRHRAGRQPTMV